MSLLVRKLLVLSLLPLLLHRTQGESSVEIDPAATSSDVVADVDGTERPETGTEEPPVKKLPHRIVNGTRAVPGQFPQQVSLRRRYSQSHFCGGSIVSVGWIITAGHCTVTNLKRKIEPYSILVVAGEVLLKNSKSSRQSSQVKDILVHPDFNYDTLENDLALLQLRAPLTIDEYVKPVRIAGAAARAGTVCQVSGWGYQKYEDKVVSSHLMYVDVAMIPVRLCRKLLVNYTNLPEGMFCAGYVEGGRDACQGDSGGGLLCEGSLQGVVSGGEGCAWPRLPGLYSDVKFYSSWIKQHVNLTGKFVSSRPVVVGRASGSSSSFSPFTSYATSPLALLVVALLCVRYSPRPRSHPASL